MHHCAYIRILTNNMRLTFLGGLLGDEDGKCQWCDYAQGSGSRMILKHSNLPPKLHLQCPWCHVTGWGFIQRKIRQTSHKIIAASAASFPVWESCASWNLAHIRTLDAFRAWLEWIWQWCMKKHMGHVCYNRHVHGSSSRRIVSQSRRTTSCDEIARLHHDRNFRNRRRLYREMFLSFLVGSLTQNPSNHREVWLKITPVETTQC